MIKCKYEGTGIWNGRCTGTNEVDPCPGYDKCKQYKPNYTTNADRIRAMSDEELAEMLWKTGRNYRAVCADPVVDYNEYRDHLISWLKQPMERCELYEPGNFCERYN